MYVIVGAIFSLLFMPEKLKKERYIDGWRRKLRIFLFRLFLLVLCAATWPIVGLWLLLM
jgi:hypothetical protein